MSSIDEWIAQARRPDGYAYGKCGGSATGRGMALGLGLPRSCGWGCGDGHCTSGVGLADGGGISDYGCDDGLGLYHDYQGHGCGLAIESVSLERV